MTIEMSEKPKVAYIMSRFPKLTETFILFEMLTLRKLGTEVEVYPLLRESQPVAHKEAQKIIEEAHFEPFISIEILKAQWRFIRCCPRKYFGLIWEVFTGVLPSLNFLFGTLGIFAKSVKFAQDMAKSGVTHVHAHFATHPAMSAFIIHRLTGIPFSFVAHGSDLHVDRRFIDRKIQASAFSIAISEFNKEIMVKESGEAFSDRIKVVHCGVDADTFKFAPEKQNDTLQLVCVASFEPVKGHKYLVEACRVLAERGQKFDCHLIGYGPVRGQVEKQIAESGIADRFHVYGGLPRHEVLEFYARADIITLASVLTKDGKKEGIPVVLMEAMACGLPVVASRISGIPELVEDGRSGILFTPGNVFEFAEALETMAKDRDLRIKLGTAGRKKVTEDFNLYKCTEQLQQLLYSSGCAFSQSEKSATQLTAVLPE